MREVISTVVIENHATPEERGLLKCLGQSPSSNTEPQRYLVKRKYKIITAVSGIPFAARPDFVNSSAKDKNKKAARQLLVGSLSSVVLVVHLKSLEVFTAGGPCLCSHCDHAWLFTLVT